MFAQKFHWFAAIVLALRASACSCIAVITSIEIAPTFPNAPVGISVGICRGLSSIEQIGSSVQLRDNVVKRHCRTEEFCVDLSIISFWCSSYCRKPELSNVSAKSSSGHRQCGRKLLSFVCVCVLIILEHCHEAVPLIQGRSVSKFIVEDYASIPPVILIIKKIKHGRLSVVKISGFTII